MVQPKQTDPQFKLRLPHWLKIRIEHMAVRNNRSINAEIVNALEEAYPNHPQLVRGADTIARMILKSKPQIRQRYLDGLRESAEEVGESAKKAVDQLYGLVDAFDNTDWEGEAEKFALVLDVVLEKIEGEGVLTMSNRQRAGTRKSKATKS